jgi:diguanylate cyclase (GGDEF)-like protein
VSGGSALHYPERLVLCPHPGGSVVETVLVADGDPRLLRFVAVNLELAGYRVITAADGEGALELALATAPDLVLLDVTLPRLDGMQVCRQLRIHARTAHVPVIFVTSRSLVGDRVLGLAAGADDYVIWPFDPDELIARVRTTLRRSLELRTSSPLTGLPGNALLTRELARRVADGCGIALVYVDLNDFKSYNDRYGFVRGDEVITMTAVLLRESLDRVADSTAFLGHVGGDDFMVILRPQESHAFCIDVVDAFDAAIRGHYDAVDLARGHIEMPDRQGTWRRFPLVSIALGVATTERRMFADHRELVEVATEMKSFVKQRQQGSGFAVDGRTDDAGQAALA